MKPEQYVGRVAGASIVAVIGGIALMNQSATDPAMIITWWLVYTVCCGLALGTHPKDTLRTVAGLALLPALVPLIEVAALDIITGQSVHISGAQVRPTVAITIGILDWIGIWLFSFARRQVLRAINIARDPNTQKRLQNIEGVVRTLATVLGTIAMVIAGKGYFSR